ncbi:MAG: hypothetical protein KAH13_00735, partial [Tenericutes bacterium]|nr:hypothetical protein [Mycoplasmatota bacterium]
AVGMATNIPPHNLSEVLRATIYRTKHPECGIDDLLAFLKGPDFPTGGIVEGKKGIEKAFTTGKGKIIIKAKVKVEDTSLIVEEIPYEVNKADLVRKIDDIRIQKKIDGILEVKDMSDRVGLSIVINLKKEISSEVILAYLFKNTDLKVSYNYNLVAICQRSPKLLGVAEVLDEFIQHQKEVIRNRSNYELRRSEKRKHIVLGFLNMVEVLDEVIKMIRQSLGKRDAIDRIVEHFNFTEIQADAIVSLQLYRLSTTDVKEMRKEAGELTKLINKLNRILTNEGVLEDVIIKELEEILVKYPTKRKSEIQDEIQKVEIDEQELIQNEEVRFVISRAGYIKRSSLKSYQATQSDTGLKENDLVLKQCTVNTRDNIILFTNFGNFILLPVYKAPDLKWRDTGEFISNFANLMAGERVIDFVVTKDFNSHRLVLLANQEGQVKQIPIEDFQKTRINRAYNCMPANRMNQLVSVDIKESYDKDVVLVSHNGYILKYSLDEVPIQSLNAKGVKGMNLRDDHLIGARYTTEINKDEVILLTNRGGLIRDFTINIQQSHRPAKGKLRLKNVKTNPYRFMEFISTNVFRLKDLFTLRVLGELEKVVIPGVDILPDRFEYGIPVIAKSKKPMYLSCDIDNYEEINKILDDLYFKSDDKVVVKEDSNDVMFELEKIISGSKSNKSSSLSDIDIDESIEAD